MQSHHSIEFMTKPLDNEHIRQLRGRSHALQPVVMIAGDGLTDNIRDAIDAALLAHELIKIRIRADRKQRAVITDQILQQTAAAKVMSIGQVLCIYRQRPDQGTPSRCN